MFYAMEAIKEGNRIFNRALRVKPFPSPKKAIHHAKLKAKGIPFVTKQLEVIWTGESK